MSTAIVKSLRAELDKIASEIEILSRRAESFRAVIAHYEERGESEDATPPAKEMRNAILGILEAEGKPLHYRTIHERLLSAGITVGGKNPVANVGAHLSIDSRFENVGRGLWALKRWGMNHTRQPMAERLLRHEAPDTDLPSNEAHSDDPPDALQTLESADGTPSPLPFNGYRSVASR